MFSFFKNLIDPKAKLKTTLKGYNLPSFPAVIMQILQKIRNPYSSAADVAEFLSLDPMLSVRLLSLANSAAFSPSKRIANMTQAVALVGMSQLESIVLGAGVARGIPGKKSKWYDPVGFWLIAAKRAMLASELALILCPAKESECFTAAFLQDMALPFLATHRSEEYDSIFTRWHEKGEDLAQLEREVFGWDHAEVATWISSEWGLPENIALAIKHHHNGDTKVDDNYEILAPVQLVSVLREDEANNGEIELFANAESVYNISGDKMESIIRPAFERAKVLARLIV